MASEPQRPADADCCGNGCRSCVFDIYEEELKIWKRKNEPASSSGQRLMSRDDYVQCVLTRVEPHCANVFLFHFRLPDDVRLVFDAGQHLIAQESGPEKTVCRPYTVASRPGSVAEFTVLIKLYERGLMSELIRSRWNEGQSVAWRGPIGDVEYQPRSRTHVLLIAAGTGLVPVFQLAQKIVEDEDEETRVTLFFCCRGFDKILLRQELRRLRGFWNFGCRFFLSDETQPECGRHGESVCFSKLTVQRLQEEVANLQPEVSAETTAVFVCGPKPFESDVKNSLREMGWPQVHVF